MNIIFLDFDGVMATCAYCNYLEKCGEAECDSKGRPWFDPSCTENLRKIIDATDADVVVTSDWKYIDKYDDLLRLWKERNMPGCLIDVTADVSKRRGDEIDAWLRECIAECNYVIIDDLDESNFNPHQLPYLLRVASVAGLDEEAVRGAISILR